MAPFLLDKLATLLMTASIVLLLVLLLLVLIVWKEHRKYDHIPGPKRRSFLRGNFPEVEGKGKLLSELFLEHALVYGPIFVWWNFFWPIVVISGPELIKLGLVTLNLPKAPSSYDSLAYIFGRHRFLGSGLVTQLNHQKWKSKRNQLNPAFYRSYLKDLVPQFNSIADALISKLSKVADGKTVINMVDEFQKVTLDVIAKVAFSLDLHCLDDHNCKVHRNLSKCLEGYSESYYQPLLSLSLYKQSYQKTISTSISVLRQCAKECIEQRLLAMEDSKKRPNDILQMILEAFDVNSKNSHAIMEELVDEFLTFFLAGQDTTANQLSFTLLETLLNEDIENRIFQEVDNVIGGKESVEFFDIAKMQYLGQTLKESLRKHPVVGGIARVTTKAEKFGQYLIPKGAKLHFSIFVSHHLPEFWDNPESFLPERFADNVKPSNFVYLPFSCGPRICIGKVFSAINATIIMARIFQKFKFQLVPGQTVQWDDNLTIFPKDGVLCTVKERISAI